jgi:hypothetical protein
MLQSPSSTTPAPADRQNLATGKFSEYCVRAWAALRLIRAYQQLGDKVGLQEITDVLKEKLPTWPPEVQRFVLRSLTAIDTDAACSQEAAR